MEITLGDVTQQMYHTTNEDYGSRWREGEPICKSFTQSTPYKEIHKARRVPPFTLPKDRSAIALCHNPENPCGIMTLSNVVVDTKGKFTNVRRDLHSDRQGLWCNAMFNRQDATIDRGVGTYSNLQGSWGRVGPSTYDAIHDKGDWVRRWGTHTFEPATIRSLYDHPNVDPRDNLIPMECAPQNMNY